MIKINGNIVNCGILLNMPRLTFTTNMNCLMNAIGRFGFPTLTCEGVYWDQCMQNGLKPFIQQHELILFVDYDTVFNHINVIDLLKSMYEVPDADAMIPIQIARHHNLPLCFDSTIDYTKKYQRIHRGHFGLTVVRSSAISKMPKPWFKSIPNDQGEWEEGKTDADLFFWDKMKETGNKVYTANHICLGHMDLMIKYPTGPNTVGIQTAREFSMNGIPKNVKYHYQEEVLVDNELILPTI